MRFKVIARTTTLLSVSLDYSSHLSKNKMLCVHSLHRQEASRNTTQNIVLAPRERIELPQTDLEAVVLPLDERGIESLRKALGTRMRFEKKSGHDYGR